MLAAIKFIIISMVRLKNVFSTKTNKKLKNKPPAMLPSASKAYTLFV
jgi:hypothetical protein